VYRDECAAALQLTAPQFFQEAAFVQLLGETVVDDLGGLLSNLRAVLPRVFTAWATALAGTTRRRLTSALA
jgi:hypothetical protein